MAEASELNEDSRSVRRRNQAQVLLVDDEEIILDEYRELLELSGINCLVTSDPFAALDLVVANHEIRIVVTDLIMPKMRGDELIMRLDQAVGSDRQMRYIVMSGYSSGEMGAVGMKVAQIDKPVSAESLVTCIGDALGG